VIGFPRSAILMLTAAFIGFLVFLALSAFFSGSETALMSLNRYRLRHLEEQRGHRATTIRRVLTYPEKVLGTILTGNVFLNTAASSLVTYAVTLSVSDPERRAEAITLATFALTALILLFGEMIPKSIAARHPERWSFLVIGPVVFFIWLLSPVVKLLTLISNGFLRLFGEVPRPLRHEIPLEELEILVASAEMGGEPGGKRQMLRKVFELGETRVSEVMVPRTEIVAVEVDAPLEEIVSLIQKQRFSRMPVYRETLDTIEGLVYSKDITTYWGKTTPFRLAEVLRKPYFLPDGAKVEQALEQMQKQRVHMALVVDEHGGVEGMVTLEDLLEEIVGELSEEQEEEVPPIRTLTDGSYLLSGSISVKDLNDNLGLDLPEEPDYNTLAGLILTRLGRIPAEGEELLVEGLLLHVERVSHRRVVRVKARPVPAKPDGGGP